MALLPTSRGIPAVVDDADLAELSQYSWQLIYKNNGTYPCVRRHAGVGKPKLSLASHIMRPDPGYETDHINGDSLDNRRSNLRVCTHAENMLNRRKPRRTNSKTTLKGVTFMGHCNKKNPWYARVAAAGARLALGYYPTEREAADAYSAWALLMHGEFSNTTI